ncbi:MAG: shikimate kinase [Desulfobacterales bacterium]|nr:shikimate kinase [Desulfobacterales bacterium]
MNIVLIGYRGTGKTSVGTALSKRLGKDFCDTDDYIGKKVKMPISDLVATKGWAFFREKEKDAIREVSSFEDCVIAAGGGAVLDDENVKNLKKNGVVVLLEATTQTIVERMRFDKKTEQQRPSLTDKDPYEEIEEVLEFRMPIYQRAMDFSVDTTSKSIDQVLDEIVRKLQKYEEG